MRAFYAYMEARTPWVLARTEKKTKYGKYLFRYDTTKDWVTILSRYDKAFFVGPCKVLFDGPYSQLPD
jgi:hypothetical protein